MRARLSRKAQVEPLERHKGRKGVEENARISQELEGKKMPKPAWPSRQLFLQQVVK